MLLTDAQLMKFDSWEEKFLAGDHSDDDWLLHALNYGFSDDGAPLIFRGPQSHSGILFVHKNGINLTKKDANSETILFDPYRFDDETFAIISKAFSDKTCIDLCDKEGFTALSVQIKFGNLDRARILLENGASPNSVAYVERYGGKSISVAKQALIMLVEKEEKTGENEKIFQAFELLKEFGYRANSEEKSDLFSEANKMGMNSVSEWIEQNF